MNMQASKEIPGTVASGGTFSEKLWNQVCLMLESADHLREALIHRESQLIWSILADQEKHAVELEKTAEIWQQVSADSDDENILQAKKEIRTKIKTLKMREKVNYNLARSYVSAIERSFVKAGAGLAGKKKVYDQGGRLGLKSKSFMLKTSG